MDSARQAIPLLHTACFSDTVCMVFLYQTRVLCSQELIYMYLPFPSSLHDALNCSQPAACRLREHQSSSLARLIVAHLSSQSFHVFSHEVLFGRFSSAPLDILPRSVGPIFLRRF